MSFSALDWIIVVLYLVGMVGIGFYFSARQTSTQEFFLGGQRFGFWSMSLSVLATSVSAITFIGQPGFVVEKDWSTLMSCLVAVPSIFVVALLFVPFFWQLRLVSSYGYLNARFDAKVSLLCGFLFLMMRGVLAGVAIYAPSLALSAVTGWNLTACIIISGVLTIFYTSLGGMSAVVWTDVVQAIVLFGGAVLAMFLLANQLPGRPSDWFSQLSADKKFNVFDFRLSLVDLTFWGSTLGGLFYTVAFYGTDQVLVQRYLSSKSLKDAKRSLFLNAIYIGPVVILFNVIGSLLYLFLKGHSAEFPTQLSSDQIFPFYLVKFLPAGLPGLMVAAIYAAAMSTLSSVLNSLATVTINDFYKRWRPNETEERYVTLGKRWTYGWGILAIFTALFTNRINDSVALACYKGASLFMGAMLGVFLLGMLSRRATPQAAFVSCIVGIIVTFIAGFGTALEMFWLTALGTGVTMLVGVGIAMIRPPSRERVTTQEQFTVYAWRRTKTNSVAPDEVLIK